MELEFKERWKARWYCQLRTIAYGTKYRNILRFYNHKATIISGWLVQVFTDIPLL